MEPFGVLNVVSVAFWNNRRRLIEKENVFEGFLKMCLHVKDKLRNLRAGICK